jgi:hypothetical protein
MGANGSKSQVHVQLGKPYYYTGDTVTGNAYAHIVSPVEIKDLSLKVEGARL